MDLAQQALGRAGVGRDTGNDGAGQVDNGTLNQVEDNIDGAAEDGEGEETVGADEGVDELGVGLNELPWLLDYIRHLDIGHEIREIHTVLKAL